MKLGIHIRNLRRATKASQGRKSLDTRMSVKELSDKTGISVRDLVEIERGELIPDANHLLKIAKGLDIPSEMILSRVTEV